MSARPALLAALLAGSVTGSACAAAAVAPAGKVGAFSFDYLVAGEGAARPLQVFDDGVSTYLQYRLGGPMPAFVSPDGQQLFLPRLHGPYIVLDAVPRDLVALLGRSRVRITHAALASNAVQLAPPGRVALPRTTAGRKEDRSWTEASYATPARGDQIQWRHRDEVLQDFIVRFAAGSSDLMEPSARLLRARAPGLAVASRIHVVGREDGTHKEGLALGRAAAVADGLVAAGVPRSRIALEVDRGTRASGGSGEVAAVTVRAFAARVYAPPGAARDAHRPLRPADQGPRFQLRAADATLAANLMRWANGEGWRVVVRDAPEITVVGDAEIQQPDFLSAAEFAVAQARATGYPIRAAAQGNRVLLLLREELE